MPSAALISLSTALSRSSNSPRYFAPATSAPRSSASSDLSLSDSGTSPLTMRSARPSAMAVLPTPGSPISTGIVLGAAGQHLDGAADFLVAADHRVELALARGRSQVAGVFLQRIIGVLGGGGVGGAALAQIVSIACSAPGRDPADDRILPASVSFSTTSASSSRSTVTNCRRPSALRTPRCRRPVRSRATDKAGCRRRRRDLLQRCF